MFPIIRIARYSAWPARSLWILWSLGFLLSLALGFAPVQAAGADSPLPAAIDESTSIEGVTEYRLANGLRVLLIPDASVDTVTVNVTYLVGSRHEGYGEAGMAHLLEHMLFRGTPSRPSIWAELKKRDVVYVNREGQREKRTPPATVSRSHEAANHRTPPLSQIADRAEQLP